MKMGEAAKNKALVTNWCPTLFHHSNWASFIPSKKGGHRVHLPPHCNHCIGRDIVRCSWKKETERRYPDSPGQHKLWTRLQWHRGLEIRWLSYRTMPILNCKIGVSIESDSNMVQTQRLIQLNQRRFLANIGKDFQAVFRVEALDNLK